MDKFREKTRLFKVYHIHLKGNSDIQEGYVGITRRSLEYRLGQHMNSTRPVGIILRSLGKDAVTISLITMGTKEEALRFEQSLRPDRNMGWNTRAGGGQATVFCEGCGKALPKRRLGSMCLMCNDTRFAAGSRPSNYGAGEHYLLISPEGVEYKPEAFTAFCREHGLTPQNLRKVAKGTRKNHKGWKAARLV